jgi:hypothetical protein
MRANGLKHVGKPAVDDFFADELKVEGLEPFSWPLRSRAVCSSSLIGAAGKP